MPFSSAAASAAASKSCNGWVRVATGFRLVASSYAARTSETTTILATRTLEHSVDASKHFKTVLSSLSPQQAEWMKSVFPNSAHPTSDRSNNPIQHLGKTNTAEGAATTTSEFTEKSLNSSTVISSSDCNCQKKIDQIHQIPVTEPILRFDVDQNSSSTKPADDGVNGNEQSFGREKILNSTPTIPADLLSSSTFIPSSDVDENPPSNLPFTDQERYEGLREGRAVPASRFSRAAGFAALGVGIAMGTAAEYAARLLGSSSNSSGSSVVNDANADRLAATLCRMRGAALKMGQMLSIQDESLLPPALTRALKQVRQGADAMPKRQLLAQLRSELGENWRDKFLTFDEVPFAAASIGQVHRATIQGDNGGIKQVVVKVQFPGVANSISSDLNNLKMLVQMTGLAPRGLFIDNVIRVGREELQVECDYLRELENQKRFKQLVDNDPILQRERFLVPDVISDLTSRQVITSEYAPGGTIDKVSNLSQDERNRIGRYIMYLTIQELFVWRFMQTDPNWGNFLFDVGTGTTYLVDFGAARDYSKDFVDGYLRIVWASANRDEKTLFDISHRMNFLTGEENDLMLHAHKQSGFTVAEPFLKNEPFDFRGSNISSRLSEHTSVFLQHRLT